MIRRSLGPAIVAMTFILLLPLAAAAQGPVTVDCGDGFPISGTIDIDSVTQLEGSIQGMLDNPSGTTCSLSQLSVTDPLSTPSDPGSFAVGGGRYDRDVCPLNFALSGHVDASGAHGTQTITA